MTALPSSLPPSLFEALDADPTLWPGPLSAEGRVALDTLVAPLPPEVRNAIVSAMVDPERNDWSRAASLGLILAATAGAKPLGLATDDLIEMVDVRGERFGLQPLGFRLPAEPCGPAEDVVRLLDGLDATFAHRRYVLYLRRPVPAGIDIAPICRAVQLWLSQVDRGDRAELHAVYEDDDVAIDLTVVEPQIHSEIGGRVLTVGPVAALERLGAVDARLVEAASRTEESVGSLPLVMVAAADRPWGLSRGFVQQLLFGTPDRVSSDRGSATGGADGGAVGSLYEAEFTPNGRSLFSDPACRTISALWWIESQLTVPPDPLSFLGRAYDNPWATSSPALPVAAPRFAPVAEPDRKRRVVLKWVRP